MRAKRKVCDVDLLVEWEFQFFNFFSIYKDTKDFTTALNSLISHQQFQLISKLMSQAKKFSNQEVVELFHLGDKFLVSGETKERLFSLFVEHLSSENDINIPELFCLNLWKEFANRLNFNKAIEMCEYSIKLNGLRVILEKKEETFVVLRNLAKNYNALYMQDIPLSSNDLKVIHSDLTELHIENCPFNFEEQLDLSQLTRLTHFTCSKCFADHHLLFTLDSLPDSLEYLDISDNLLNPIDHSPLVDWIEKQKSLKHLNLSGNNLNTRSAPNIFDILFNHPSLEVLNLKDNYLRYEFLKQLNSFPGTLNWKSLTVDNISVRSKKSDFFNLFFKTETP